VNNIEIVYDATPRVIYDDPIQGREDPYKTGELEEMFVDDGYEEDPLDLPISIKRFLGELHVGFAHRNGDFITYQEILEFAREHTTLVKRGYDRKAHPMVTTFMNRLWKAGLIKKYRRGLWSNALKHPDTVRGRNHGITFWIW